jgi:putative protease
MSPKDLCTISFLDKILETGVDILKIEGRARSAEYVKIVTQTYREALDSIKNKTYTSKKIEKWISLLKTVYNRGFWHGGYYLNKSLDSWSNFYGSKASKKKIYIGKVTNFFSKINICELLIHSGVLKVFDDILIIGNKTGALFYKIKNLRRKRKISIAKKGDLVTFSIPKKVRKNDKIIRLLEKRLKLASKTFKYKKKVFDKKREEEILKKIKSQYIRDIYLTIFKNSKKTISQKNFPSD